jgi:PBP1b-binding outer membrane lipoprotein LpoB
MKKTASTIIIALLVVFLTSCAKKSNVQADSLYFFSNPFTAKSILATAD